jgi:imidazolonepropionase-like amidohydrolase
MAWIRNRRLLTAMAIVAILVVAGFFGRANPSAQAPSAAQSTKRVALVGGMLLTGYDVPPIHNAVVLIEGTKIAAIGTKAEVKIPPDATIVDTSGKTMLPGLIEAHGHVIVLGAGDYASWFPWINAHGGEKMLTKVMETAAREMLMAGVTTEVDLGAPLSVLSVRDRINKGEIAGTRILASGPWISRIRGGGDGGAMQVGFGGLNISSPEQAAAEVDRLAKAGVDLIKAHGGLTAADYKAIADAAHKNRIRVHAHVYAEQDVRNALENGIDVLQHVGSAGSAPPYSKELITDIANAGRPVVVTAAHRAWIYADTAAFPERLQNPVLKQIYPPDIYEEVQRSLTNWTTLGYFNRTDREMLYRERGVKQFIESGAVMGMGTDSGTPMNFHSESLWREIKVHVDMGMTPLRAIQAATRVNAQIINRRDLGSIAPGQTADIIAVDGNPLFDIVALSHVDVVVKDGTVYKGGPAAANKPRTTTASAK